MTEFQKIADARKMRTGINIKGIVQSKGIPRDVHLKTGGVLKTCEVLVYDESDSVSIQLWDEDIKKVNIGDEIIITNGYTNTFKELVSITSGKFGKMEIIPWDGKTPIKSPERCNQSIGFKSGTFRGVLWCILDKNPDGTPHNGIHQVEWLSK